MEIVEEAAGDPGCAPAHLQSFVANLKSYGNVPRNEKKFSNFVKNSLNVRRDDIVSALWAFLLSKQAAARTAQDAEAATAAPRVKEEAAAAVGKKRKANDGAAAEGEETKQEDASKKSIKASKKSVAGDVNWAKAIKKALKAAPGKTLSTKALRKAVSSSAGASGLGKDDVKSAVKSALRCLPKVVVEGSCVVYRG